MELLTTYHLESLCIGVGLFGLIILSRRLPLVLAATIVTLRLGVSYVYFCDDTNDRYQLYDDVVYIDKAHAYLQAGFTPWEALTRRDAALTLSHVAQSEHTLYYLWTATALYAFGDYYYAPVMLNILLTFFTAELFARGLEMMQLPRRYQRFAIAYQSLHMNYFTWVAFMNVKEALVEFLLMAMVVSLLSFLATKRKRSLVFVAASAWLLLSLRLYVPLLVLAGTALSAVTILRGFRRALLLPVLLLAVAYLGQRVAGESHWAKVSGIATGSVRFLLTPRPWAIEPEYEFVFLASVQQWIMFVPMLIGCYCLWRLYPKARIMICILGVFVLFYGMWPEHQGPRHRVQLSSIMSLAEFQFIWVARQVENVRQRHPSQPALAISCTDGAPRL